MKCLRKSAAGSRSALSRGLTLIEALVAMGIAVIAGVLLLTIIVNSVGIFSKQLPKVQQGLGINDALSAVRNNIKQANAVGSGYTDGATTYTSGATQLVLEIPAIDSSGNIIANAVDFFIFFLDQNLLRFKIFPDPLSGRRYEDRIFSNQAESLNFQYLSNATPETEAAPSEAVKVRITVTLKQKAGAGFEVNTATTEANLRND